MTEDQLELEAINWPNDGSDDNQSVTSQALCDIKKQSDTLEKIIRWVPL